MRASGWSDRILIELEHAAGTQSGLVILVDDDADGIAAFNEEIADAYGIDFVHIRSLDEAATRLRNLPQTGCSRPILILDLMMPDEAGQGLGFLQRLRRGELGVDSDTPTIVNSACKDETIEGLIEVEGAEFFSKGDGDPLEVTTRIVELVRSEMSSDEPDQEGPQIGTVDLPADPPPEEPFLQPGPAPGSGPEQTAPADDTKAVLEAWTCEVVDVDSGRVRVQASAAEGALEFWIPEWLCPERCRVEGALIRLESRRHATGSHSTEMTFASHALASAEDQARADETRARLADLAEMLDEEGESEQE